MFLVFPQCFFLLLSCVKAQFRLFSVVFLVLLQTSRHFSALAHRMAKQTQLHPPYAQQLPSRVQPQNPNSKHAADIFSCVIYQLALQNPFFIVEPSIAIWIRTCKTKLTGHLPYWNLVGGCIAVG